MEIKDFISSPEEGKHIFTLDEIRQCIHYGVCVGCGICCISFRNDIPSAPPSSPEDNTVEAVRKDSLEVCKHLVETNEGIFRCSIHNQKDHPVMYACKGWEGNQRNSSYEEKNRVRAELIILQRLRDEVVPPEDILLMDKMYSRGIAGSINLEEYWRAIFCNSKARNQLFRNLISADKLPINILEKIDFLRGIFQSLSKESKNLFLQEIGFDENNTVHKELLDFLEQK